ncbi:hypothetical protein [Streptomyces sp. 142MFCol3.1]|uniref:hypothetical protein n=1 Tax=Streptomyces sp. 142MFCol3.1 TaxID=1172179 RepID=UPI00131A2E16|nr:hypothetical protein [Streptomyces sp. 142MFCol3.1]
MADEQKQSEEVLGALSACGERRDRLEHSRVAGAAAGSVSWNPGVRAPDLHEARDHEAERPDVDAEARLAEFARHGQELLRSGTADGAITLAERLARRGEPQKAVAHLLHRQDGAKVLHEEHLRRLTSCPGPWAAGFLPR